jgi:hypothetical protein
MKWIALLHWPKQEKRIDELTPMSRVLLAKLTVTQLDKRFPAIYGTRRFVIVFSRDRHWSVSLAG